MELNELLDAVAARGACYEAVRRLHGGVLWDASQSDAIWLVENAPDIAARVAADCGVCTSALPLLCLSGHGSGYAYGHGSGYGCGYGYAYEFGDDGYGDGYGYGYVDGRGGSKQG